MSMLFSHYKIEDVELKNRFVMAPMCMYKALDNGELNEFHFAHYGARAIGGVGLITTEATAVEKKGRISDNDLGIWCDEQIDGHKRVNEISHIFGAKTSLQLAHAGRKSLCASTTPIAPSSIIFANEGGFKTPKELSKEEINLVINSFVKGAKRAKIAGYDMVEVHAAHGYLLSEFLSPITNQRKDEFGGSLELRCSLVITICKRILKEVDLPVLVRISASEWMANGWDIKDSIYLSKILKNIGVSMIHVSAGGNNVKQRMPQLLPLYQADYAKKIKKESDIPTIAVGLITNYNEGEMLLENDTCDLVAYGRELLRNPNLVQYCAKKQGLDEVMEVSYKRAF